MDNGDLLSLLGILVTSFVALRIFNKWTSQKASEVVANEAKQFIINLSKLQSLQSEIHKIIYTSDGYDSANLEFEEFKRIHKLLNNSGVFLGKSLKDVEISHYSTTVMAQAIGFENDIDKYKTGEKSLDKIRMIDPNDAEIISDIYLEYALYKKTIS